MWQKLDKQSSANNAVVSVDYFFSPAATGAKHYSATSKAFAAVSRSVAQRKYQLHTQQPGVVHVETPRDDIDPFEHTRMQLRGHLPSRVCRFATDPTQRPGSVHTSLDC